MVWVTEDIFDGTAVDCVDQLRAFAESEAEQWMLQIGFGFADSLNGVFPGGGACAEAFDLRKDEPHPVGFFLAGLQFVADLAVDGVLGIDKSLQVVGVGGHGCSGIDFDLKGSAFAQCLILRRFLRHASYRYVDAGELSGLEV
jgi:hypothetical protein